MKVIKNGREFVVSDDEDCFTYSPEELTEVRIKASKGLFPYGIPMQISDEELAEFLFFIDSGNYSSYLREIN